MNEGGKRIARGDSDISTNLDMFKTIQRGEVISVDDPLKLDRIKVRIKGPSNRGGDDGISDSDLSWCSSLMPKYFLSTPKVNEAVYIFIINRDKEFIDRLYIGPIISQPDKLSFDPYYFSSLRGFSFANQLPDVSIDNIPELIGIFPNKSDVSIQGRHNTDITQKINEIVIRAGKFENSTVSNENPYPFKYNSKTQGYIQIKNDVIVTPKTDNNNEEKGTVTNIVSNKINLLTHKYGNPRFDLTNQLELITNDELAIILKDAHQLPFGDILLQYLILLKEAIIYHVHNGSGNPATDLTISGNKQSIAILKSKADDLEKSLLSKNIRIN